jgi:hypothetical protein
MEQTREWTKFKLTVVGLGLGLLEVVEDVVSEEDEVVVGVGLLEVA